MSDRSDGTLVLEGDDILTVQHALAQRLKQVRAELAILEITRKRKLLKFERSMLPAQLYHCTEAELEEQVNPWRTLESAIHYILEDMEAGGPVQKIQVDVKGMEILASMGQRLLTNPRPLAEYIDRWPQAAAELSGFVRALRRKAGITADQVQMACELAEMRYQQLLAEANFRPGAINEDTETPTGTAVLVLRAEARNLVELGIDPETVKLRFAQLVDEVAKEHSDRQATKSAATPETPTG